MISEIMILKTLFEVIKDSIELENYDNYDRFIDGVVRVTEALLKKVHNGKTD